MASIETNRFGTKGYLRTAPPKTGIQRGGSVIAATVSRAKPSGKELDEIFRGHIVENTLVLADGLRSYNVLFAITFRYADNLKDMLFSSLCTVGQNCYWHSVNDVRNYKLVIL